MNIFTYRDYSKLEMRQTSKIYWVSFRLSQLEQFDSSLPQ